MLKFLATIALCLAVGCKSTPESATADPPVEEDVAQAPAGEDAAKPVAYPMVFTDATAEERVSPNGKARILRLAKGANAFLGKLTMEGGGKVPLHRDATEEYIYILEGSGVMTIDGREYEVGPNTAIYMPANAEVSFAGGPEKLVALQVFAGTGPEAKYDAWAPAQPQGE